MTSKPNTAANNQVYADTAGMKKLSEEIQLSAATVGNQSKEITNNDFGPGQAGRNYSNEGTQLHNGLAKMARWLTNWDAAVKATGTSMGQGVVQYTNVDAANATKQNANK